MLSCRRKLARLLLLAVLEVGAVMGVPMNPREIEDLLQLMNRTEIQETISRTSDET